VQYLTKSRSRVDTLSKLPENHLMSKLPKNHLMSKLPENHLMSSSKTNFILKSIRVSKIFFIIRYSIDNSKFEIQRCNFEFWDGLDE